MTDTPSMPVAAPARSGSWDIRQADSRRSLILCGIGAIVGLALAGFGLFTAEGTRTLRVPPENAAMVNGVPILMSDYIGQIVALHNIPYTQATPRQKRAMLDAMIREELNVQRAIELGLPTDDSDVRTAMVGSAQAVIEQDALTEPPSDAELRAWYAAHPDLYASEGAMTLGEFVAPPASAAGAVTALRGWTTPAALGLKSSGRVDDGEEFYFAARAHLGDRLFGVARTLKAGQVSDPVVLADGAHILVMARNQPPVPIAYGDTRDKVLQDFMKDKVAKLQAANDGFLRRRADIKIAAPLR